MMLPLIDVSTSVPSRTLSEDTSHGLMQARMLEDRLERTLTELLVSEQQVEAQAAELEAARSAAQVWRVTSQGPGCSVQSHPLHGRGCSNMQNITVPALYAVWHPTFHVRGDWRASGLWSFCGLIEPAERLQLKFQQFRDLPEHPIAGGLLVQGDTTVMSSRGGGVEAPKLVPGLGVSKDVGHGDGSQPRASEVSGPPVKLFVAHADDKETPRPLAT